ncbi:hypothetical protein QL297_000150 [Salmonella enterica]|nr:hypothetical protein [Salmonella enterica]ELW7225942.1 hypothetical protein [Salmonella enterica]
MPDRLPDITLPSWMNRGDIVRLKNTFTRFWGKVHTWVSGAVFVCPDLPHVKPA